MALKLMEYGSINDPMKMQPGEQPLVIVVLTPTGIDVRYSRDAGKELLDDAAECVEDTRRAGWGII